jgi:soluble lytic murein transglycosylase
MIWMRMVSFGVGLLLVVLVGCTAVSPPSTTSNNSTPPLSPLLITPTPDPQNILPTPTLSGLLQQQPAPTVNSATATAVAALPTVAVVAPANTPVPDVVATSVLPTAVADLAPSERLSVAQQAFFNGDSQRTISELTAALASEQLTPSEQSGALFLLGQAQADLGQTAPAVASFRAQVESSVPNPRTHFYLAELNKAGGNCDVAVAEYRAFLTAVPSLGAYIYPRLADCLTDEGEVTAVYNQALTSPAHYLVEINNRRQLASRYLQAGNFSAAIQQYQTIRDLAQTEFTKGEMTYLIGSTYQQAGNLPAAYEAYQFGVNNYPRAYESYLGLVALVEAEQPVEDYQRGLTNFYAKSYAPAIQAWQRYLAANLTEYNPETHRLLAQAYEAVADVPNARLHLDKYLATNPTDPTTIGTYYTDRAEMEARVVNAQSALATLDEFMAQHPTHPQVADARWRAAQFADRFLGEKEAAARRYRVFAEAHPTHEKAAEAWFRAGVLAQESGQLGSAVEAWQQAGQYNNEFAHAALLWLVTSLPTSEVEAYRAQVMALPRTNYYALRARDLMAGVPAYVAPAQWQVTGFDEAAEQAEVETWLRQTFGLGEDTAVTSTLSPALASDPRLLRGTELWRLGMKTEAKQELETLRIAYEQDPVASYQLALYFRDLGLYRSSIIAGSTVRWLAGATIYDAPRLLGRLAFPTYYADLVTPSAEKYGYDPLLHFALIRQESLFESFITSHAAAQGLGQVIPATGEFIAQRLQWPNYRNEDLFRPYVNLTFASYYLHQQLEAFGGNKAAALSAYNAGPGNAQRWVGLAGADHDRYLETVDFAETRDYIRRIYEWHAAYRFLYGRDS